MMVHRTTYPLPRCASIGALVVLWMCTVVPAAGQQVAPTAQPPANWGSAVVPKQAVPKATAPSAPPANVPPGAPPFKGTIDAPANTTIIARPTTESRTGGQVALVAKITEEGADVEQGLVWRIYRDKPGADGKLRLLSLHRDAAPQLRLDVGDYLINVAFGRANLTRKITVAAGKQVTEKFVINAGGLKIAAVRSTGEPLPDNSVVYQVQSDERDQFGNRITVLAAARPGATVRLNAGLYQVQSTYGDANAIVRGEVVVEPGKVTEATLVHSAARATLRLVTQNGAEALSDTQWTIQGAQGEIVKESAGALPTHILAPGIYTVVARRFGQSFRREFAVQAGETVNVEVIAQAP